MMEQNPKVGAEEEDLNFEVGKMDIEFVEGYFQKKTR